MKGDIHHANFDLRHKKHYDDVIMGAMASRITSITIVYSSVYSGPDQRKHQSSASLTFVKRIHRWPVYSPHKGPVTRKCFHLMTSSWERNVMCTVTKIEWIHLPHINLQLLNTFTTLNEYQNMCHDVFKVARPLEQLPKGYQNDVHRTDV